MSQTAAAGLGQLGILDRSDEQSAVWIARFFCVFQTAEPLIGS